MGNDLMLEDETRHLERSPFEDDRGISMEEVPRRIKGRSIPYHHART